MATREKPVAFKLATSSKAAPTRSSRSSTRSARSGKQLEKALDEVLTPEGFDGSSATRRSRGTRPPSRANEAGSDTVRDAAVSELSERLSEWSEQLARYLSDQFRQQATLQLAAGLRDLAVPDLVRTDAIERVREALSAKFTSALPDLQRSMASFVGSQASFVVLQAIQDIDLLDTQDAPDAGSVDSVVTAAPGVYTDWVLTDLRESLINRFSELSGAGLTLPDPQDMADLLSAALPATTPELDPHFADLGPFYTSDGASLQLGNITKQAVDSRRRTGTILAMQTLDSTWLYPAWQFTGKGAIHDVLVPVLRALRGMDRWEAGVWLVSDHPDLDGISPRQALREGTDPAQIAALAAADRAAAIA